MNDNNFDSNKLGRILGAILITCLVTCVCILAIAGTAKLISIM